MGDSRKSVGISSQCQVAMSINDIFNYTLPTQIFFITTISTPGSDRPEE